MRKTATPIVLSEAEHETLQSWLRAGTSEQRMAERARIILAAAAGAAASGEWRATAKPSERAAALRAGARRGRRAIAAGEVPGLEVTSVTVLPAEDEPAATLDGQPDGTDEGTASDWLPGIRDEHEGDDAGWMARWLDRPTWDRRVTPNVVKRTGERPRRRRFR